MNPRPLAIGAVLAGFVAAGAIGCADILGARFDDATPAGPDAGGATDAPSGPEAGGGDASNVDPRKVEHLELWLAADFGVSETGPDAGGHPDAQIAPANGVALWEDRSGRTHTAFATDPTKRPLLLRDAAPLPVLAFDRARQTCLANTWTGAGVPPGLTFFVVSRGNATNVLRFGPLGTIAFPWDSNYGRPAAEPLLHLLVATGPSARETPQLGGDTNTWELLSARLVPREVGGLRTYRHGVLAEQRSWTGAELPSLDALTIGCAGLLDEFATALVGEVLVYTAALPDSDRQRIEGYLRAKWQMR
ncbi:hypothetical protein [Pendulispora albinea]|uniref:Uncharacterized protein n=1 Tax=Pendulispora albinea TaxID=2741071 RepID=A0ABZ2M816_9BACT